MSNQCPSYTLDIYLRRAAPARSFLDYALFVTFFPTVRPQKALALSHWESPSKRGSFLIQQFISPAFAMLDDNYQLSTLVFRLDRDWRRGVIGPHDDVWKAQETAAGGQTWIWADSNTIDA